MPSSFDRDTSIGCVGVRSSRGLLRGVGRVTDACNSAWQSLSQTVKGHDSHEPSSPRSRPKSWHEPVRSSRRRDASFPPASQKLQSFKANTRGSRSATAHPSDVSSGVGDQGTPIIGELWDSAMEIHCGSSPYVGSEDRQSNRRKSVSKLPHSHSSVSHEKDQRLSDVGRHRSTSTDSGSPTCDVKPRDRYSPADIKPIQVRKGLHRERDSPCSSDGCGVFAKDQRHPEAARHAPSKTRVHELFHAARDHRRSFICAPQLEEFLRPPSSPRSSSCESKEAGNWNVLPSDILHKTLGMIPSASARAVLRSVCHSWRLCIDVCAMKLRPRGVVTAAAIARWPVHYANISTLDLAHCCVNSAAKQAFLELLAAEASFPMLTTLTLPVDWLPSNSLPCHHLDILALPVLRRLRVIHLYGSTHGGLAQSAVTHCHERPTFSSMPPKPPAVGLPSYSYRERRQHPTPSLQRLAIRNAHLDYSSCADLVSGLAAVVPSLPTLLLPSNGIDVLPCSLSRLTALQTLDISGNQLFWWQNVLHTLTTLHTLDISNNPLNSWPDGLSSLISLTSLSARSAGFQSIGGSLAHLTNLKHLDLSSNPLGPSIPDPILALTSLTQLDLRSCSLSKVHTSVTALVNLQHLNVSHNRIAIFDVPLTAIPCLEYLNLSSNRLQQLRSSLPNHPEAPNVWDVFSDVTPPSNLRHLDVSSNRLEVFPMIVLQLTRLETLLMDDQKGWQWYNALPLAANGGSIRQEVYRRCPHLRTYTDA